MEFGYCGPGVGHGRLTRNRSPPQPLEGHSSSLLLPLEDIPPEIMLQHRGRATSHAGELTVASKRGHSQDPRRNFASASTELERNLLQQQLQHCQHEGRRLKDELSDTEHRLSVAATKLNEQKLENASLTHRYSATIEKLSLAEEEMKALEAQLVQERAHLHRSHEEREGLKRQLREAVWECERLGKLLEETEVDRGIGAREVQRVLQDRSQYIPTLEVHRLQNEMRCSQQGIVDRLTGTLDALLAAQGDSETSLFVARSAVLSAATDMETRLLHAESTLERLGTQLSAYQEGLEQELSDFLQGLLSENKELWRHLTKLQAEHDAAATELQRRQKMGAVVPKDQHNYVQRQLENAVERLGKVQKVVEVQTALAKEHERKMQEVLTANDDMRERLDGLTRELTKEKEQGRTKSAALEEADAALKEMMSQVDNLHDTTAREHSKHEETVARLREEHTTVENELRRRMQQLDSERVTAEETAHAAKTSLEEATARMEALEEERRVQEHHFMVYKQTSEAASERSTQLQLDEMTRLSDVLEREMELLRRQVDEAVQETRMAVREKEDAVATARALTTAKEALEADLAALRREVEKEQRQSSDLAGRLRVVTTELEDARMSSAENGLQLEDLRHEVQRLMRDKGTSVAQWQEEKDRSLQRSSQLQRDWQDSEKARVRLQEEVSVLRARCAEIEAAQFAEERYVQEREQLMKENTRLHREYEVVQRANLTLEERLQELQAGYQATGELAGQLDELQKRLRELPQLRQTADDALRDALKAKEETEVLRRERDEMAAKLEFFLEESKTAAQMDAEFSRVCRDADAVLRRLDGQMSAATGRTVPRGGLPEPAEGQTPVHRPTAGTPRSSRAAGGYAAGGLSSARVALMDVSRSGAAVEDLTPQRPWR